MMLNDRRIAVKFIAETCEMIARSAEKNVRGSGYQEAHFEFQEFYKSRSEAPPFYCED